MAACSDAPTYSSCDHMVPGISAPSCRSALLCDFTAPPDLVAAELELYGALRRAVSTKPCLIFRVASPWAFACSGC